MHVHVYNSKCLLLHLILLTSQVGVQYTSKKKSTPHEHSALKTLCALLYDKCMFVKYEKGGLWMKFHYFLACISLRHRIKYNIALESWIEHDCMPALQDFIIYCHPSQRSLCLRVLFVCKVLSLSTLNSIVRNSLRLNC